MIEKMSATSSSPPLPLQSGCSAAPAAMVSSLNGGCGSTGGVASSPSSVSGATATSSVSFETFHQNVCTSLRNRGEVHSVSKVFSQCGTDDERIKFILEQNFEAGLLRWKELNFQRKDKLESQRLRNLGNQVYQKNRLLEALDYYSQSILLAPHPAPPVSCQMQPMATCSSNGQAEDGLPHEELALGYANRSAVLFQLKEFELCIRDITRAFDNSYPNNLMYKLFERKARCLKALKQFPRALEAMKSAEMWMKYSTLSETKTSSFKKEVNKQIELLDEKVSSMDISEFSSDQRKNMSMPLKVLPLPATTKGSSKELPCVREDVKLQFCDKRGRFLVATDDIPAGQVIITETPYSCILLPEYYATHCQFCFNRSLAPLPCWYCAKVRFCSDECRLEAWERFHKVECQQLDLILDPSLGKMGMLAMRILTSSGKIYLDYIIHKVTEENDSRRAKLSAMEVQRLLGFNEDGVYDAADYRTIFTLVTSAKQRSVGDLFKRALMAAYLLKILEMTPFFYNGGSDPRNVKMADKVAMGSILLKHLQNLPCNAHEITEMELAPMASPSVGSVSSLAGSGLSSAGSSGGSIRDGSANVPGAPGGSGSTRDAVVHEIGAAVFGTLSLLNHSCDPNVVRHYYSSNAAVRTIRAIRKGEELLDNYGYHYAVMNKVDRQKNLSGQYYFSCTCTACLDNWQTYAKLPTTLEPLPGQDEKALMAEAHKRSKSYKKAFDMVLQGSYSDALPTLIEYLNFLDGHFKRPVREYNECQEAIKQCLSANANAFHPIKPGAKQLQ